MGPTQPSSHMWRKFCREVVAEGFGCHEVEGVEKVEGVEGVEKVEGVEGVERVEEVEGVEGVEEKT